jgi:hypothetical protein
MKPGASLVVWLGLSVAACFVDPGVQASGPDAGTTGTTGTTAAPTSSSGESTTPPPATSSSTTIDATTSSSTTTLTTETTTTETTTTGEDSTTGGALEQLQHHDPEQCKDPLWCYADGDIQSGVAGRISSAECYVSTLAPPIALERVRYIVAATFGDLAAGAPLIRVYTVNDAMQPGPVILEAPLAADAVTLGAHESVLDPPLLLPAPGFCVGLVGGSDTPPAALGVAIDGQQPAPGTTFIKIAAPSACSIPEFQDVADVMPKPSGHWCIAATVSTM